ncbi:hypothetical protein KDA_02250 [Dictyobacter alpinus]|uniref:Blue (type 1) copper domain-containing protein n=1 Tax=Dictyobacter alpinus TaxID=2014873 RepID=A0A402B054_9CHLR|nr:plastocyanin/azurin family copper-binding protein [Dictyobacter alpinus]GCE24741.1 hypothetical protein KDA_02250 [Dictyobacter alpinus]
MNKKILFGLLALTLMTVLFSACRVIDANSIPKNVTAHMGAATFIQTQVEVPKGQKLDLVDDVSAGHVIKNGTWKGSKADETKEQGAPDVNSTFTGNDKISVGPFNTAGTFQLYCTIHGGMNLTVVVK